jgi:outer membrane protein TolC
MENSQPRPEGRHAQCREYRAAYRIGRPALLPSVNGTAGAIIQQVPVTLSGTGSQEEYEQ